MDHEFYDSVECQLARVANAAARCTSPRDLDLVAVELGILGLLHARQVMEEAGTDPNRKAQSSEDRAFYAAAVSDVLG